MGGRGHGGASLVRQFKENLVGLHQRGDQRRDRRIEISSLHIRRQRFDGSDSSESFTFSRDFLRVERKNIKRSTFLRSESWYGLRSRLLLCLLDQGQDPREPVTFLVIGGNDALILPRFLDDLDNRAIEQRLVL